MADANRSIDDHSGIPPRGMRCPICDGGTRVLRTDAAERRRECERCHHRFTTVELLKEKVERTEAIIRDAQELAVKIIAEDA